MAGVPIFVYLRKYAVNMSLISYKEIKNVLTKIVKMFYT